MDFNNLGKVTSTVIKIFMIYIFWLYVMYTISSSMDINSIIKDTNHEVIHG